MKKAARTGSPAATPTEVATPSAPRGGGDVLVDLSYENVVQNVVLARDAAAGAVRDRLPDGDVEVVRLLTSELVANCHRHGRGTIRLTVVAEDGFVVVTVRDDGHGAVRIRDVGTEPGAEPGGYGMRLVETLSDRWEQLLDGNGTTVRFSMALPGAVS